MPQIDRLIVARCLPFDGIRFFACLLNASHITLRIEQKEMGEISLYKYLKVPHKPLQTLIAESICFRRL